MIGQVACVRYLTPSLNPKACFGWEFLNTRIRNGSCRYDSSPSEGTQGEAFVSFVESTLHSCFSVKKKEEDIALGALGRGFPKPLIEWLVWSKRKELALLRGTSLFESNII